MVGRAAIEGRAEPCGDKSATSPYGTNRRSGAGRAGEPPGVQVKRLRLLEDRTVRRAGGGCDRKMDVRVSTATRRSLEPLAAEP